MIQKYMYWYKVFYYIMKYYISINFKCFKFSDDKSITVYSCFCISAKNGTGSSNNSQGTPGFLDKSGHNIRIFRQPTDQILRSSNSRKCHQNTMESSTKGTMWRQVQMLCSLFLKKNMLKFLFLKFILLELLLTIWLLYLGIKKYIVGLIIKTSSDAALLEKEKVYVGKLNMILVQVCYW